MPGAPSMATPLPPSNRAPRPISGPCSWPAARPDERLAPAAGNSYNRDERWSHSGSGADRMKCMIVYYIDGKWYGEEVAWKRSGSGTYREISRIEIPQSKDAIEA